MSIIISLITFLADRIKSKETKEFQVMPCHEYSIINDIPNTGSGGTKAFKYECRHDLPNTIDASETQFQKIMSIKNVGNGTSVDLRLTVNGWLLDSNSSIPTSLQVGNSFNIGFIFKKPKMNVIPVEKATGLNSPITCITVEVEYKTILKKTYKDIRYVQYFLKPYIDDSKAIKDSNGNITAIKYINIEPYVKIVEE